MVLVYFYMTLNFLYFLLKKHKKWINIKIYIKQRIDISTQNVLNCQILKWFQYFPTKGFTLTKENRLRSSLQCVVVPSAMEGAAVKLDGCIEGQKDTWDYDKTVRAIHDIFSLWIFIFEAF